jgi:hypothetical protein
MKYNENKYYYQTVRVFRVFDLISFHAVIEQHKYNNPMYNNPMYNNVWYIARIKYVFLNSGLFVFRGVKGSCSMGVCDMFTSDSYKFNFPCSILFTEVL